MSKKSNLIPRKTGQKFCNNRNGRKITNAPCFTNSKIDSDKESILRFLTRQDNLSIKHDVENRKYPQMVYKYPATKVNNFQNINCIITKLDSKPKMTNATLRVPLKNKCVIKFRKSSHLNVLANGKMSNGKDNSLCPDFINNVTEVSIRDDALIQSRPPWTKLKKRERQEGKMINSAEKSVKTSKENGKSPVKGCEVQHAEAQNNIFQRKTDSVPKKRYDISHWPIRNSDSKGSHSKCGKVLRLDKSYKFDNMKIHNDNSNYIETSHKNMDQLCSNMNILSCCEPHLLSDKNIVDERNRKNGFNSDCGKSRLHNISGDADVISKKEHCKLQLPKTDESWNKPGPSTNYCWPPEVTHQNRNNAFPERTVQIRSTVNTCTDVPKLTHSGTEINALENYDIISNYMINISEDGLVKKTIILDGDGPTIPNGSLVYIHFTAYLESDMGPFQSSYYKGLPVRGVLGQNHFISGLDIGIRTMKKGEIAAFLIDPIYGFGTNEIPCHNINKHRLLIRVETIKFRALHAGEIIERKRTHIFKFILKLAKKLYLQGVRLNELNKITLAAERFKLVIALLSLTNFADKALNSHKTYLINESMLHLAVFYNNKGHFHSAILTCLDILEQYPDNYKARLNFFKAVVAVRAYSKAYEFLKHVWKKKKEIMEYNNSKKEFLYSSCEEWRINAMVPKQDYHLSSIMKFKKWSHLERLKKLFVQRYLPVKLRGVNRVLFTTKWKHVSVST